MVNDMNGKKVLVVGMGKSGVAATEAMVSLKADVSIQDSKSEDQMDPDFLAYLKKNNVKCFLGVFPEDEKFDMVILSPGVNPEMEFVRKMEEQGAEIVGELETAYRLAQGTFVGITGTNGKTTTTTLVGEIFKEAGKKTDVVGNIGIAVISKAIESTPDEWLITETSSFQLQTIKHFKPMVSAILNLTPDHLNRHHTMEEYGKAKARIWENQDENGYLVMNMDDPVCMSLCLSEVGKPKAKLVCFSRKTEPELGAFLNGTMMVLKNEQGQYIDIIDRNELKILGDHNVENALAAACIAYFSGIEIEPIRDALRKFGGVEHRIEFSGEINGVRYYNDSKGTNVDAAVIALKALQKNIILIAGGDAKSQTFDDLVKEFNGRVKHLLLLGRDKQFIIDSCDKEGFKDYTILNNMEECVAKAYEIAEPGDSVLLSPACASWDMYPNFEKRGEHFKNCVKNLGK